MDHFTSRGYAINCTNGAEYVCDTVIIKQNCKFILGGDYTISFMCNHKSVINIMFCLLNNTVFSHCHRRCPKQIHE